MLFVRRWMGERDIVRFSFEPKKGYRLEQVAMLEPPVTRDPRDTGGNAAFDVGWYDAAHTRVVCHYDEDDEATFALDLGTLFRS